MTDPVRTAIVTGGSRGVGRRIAEVLAADGVRVLLSYRRNQADAERVVEGIERAGGTAVAVRLELESAGDIDALFDTRTAAHHASRLAQAQLVGLARQSAIQAHGAPWGAWLPDDANDIEETA